MVQRMTPGLPCLCARNARVKVWRILRDMSGFVTRSRSGRVPKRVLSYCYFTA